MMQSKTTAAVVLVLGVAAAVVLFAILSSGDDGGDGATTMVPRQRSAGESGQGAAGGKRKQEAPGLPTIVVRNGEPVGGVKELSFASGEVIRFTVESDIADEVHLHGYDISKPVSAGGKVSFTVPAEIDGVFEVELEDAVIPLAEITVGPG